MTTTPTTTTNRFLDMNRYYGTCPDHLPARTRQHSWAGSMAAADRVLVVLIENGGIDLGLPDLVNKLVDGIPGVSAVIGEDLKARMVTALRDWLLTTTDHLLESAELALNRYTAAKPDKYGDVVVLRDSTATFGELKNALFSASRAGIVVDLVILTHGSKDFISVGDGIDGARIRTMATEFGGPLNLRSVYMMNCVGASLNRAWLDVGARTSAGSHDNNYLPEPTTYFFFSAWKDGMPFEQAVTGAYRRTIDALNYALRGIVIGLVGLAGAVLADQIDVSGLPFVVSSRPEVVGVGGLSIANDALPPASGGTAGGASTGQSLVTTVLPAGRALVRAMSVDRTVSPSGRTFIGRFEAPGALLEQRILAVERFLSERIARPLTQPQIDALACFGIGIGSQALEHSTLLRMLDDGDFAAVPGEIRKWTKIRNNGQIVESEALLERRRAEAELFGGTAPTLAVPASWEVQEYAYQQNPALIAGIEVADAIQIGLGAAAIVQSQVNAFPGGSLQVTYDSQQRLLTPQARLDMPGSMRPKNTYSRTLFWLPSLRLNAAQALIKIIWDGNDYGEIGTPTITKDLDQTSDWSRSSASINIRAVSRIPVGTDPRTWSLWYHYEGSFDPYGNGQWDFNGDFEINAFGAIAFHDHKWKSRSLIDSALDVQPDTWKGPDVTAAVPTIPADQIAYLRGHAPA
jgi:GH24 family phage-related lysozyme (muramidase)